MSEFLGSLKADLLDRRLLPFVALVGVVVLAAIAYAVLGGGSSSPAASASAPVPAPANAAGISVSSANSEKAVAETTDGVSEQRSGHARNPFEPIVKASTASTTSTTSTTSSTTSATTSASSGSSGSSTTTTTTTTKTETTKKKKKAKTVYDVAIEFGVFPAGSTPETVILTPYENLELQTPLPSSKEPLIVFRGVTDGGKSATFSVVGEAILHGIGACLPSATQCEALDLKPGQSEQLEYLPRAAKRSSTNSGSSRSRPRRPQPHRPGSGTSRRPAANCCAASASCSCPTCATHSPACWSSPAAPRSPPRLMPR